MPKKYLPAPQVKMPAEISPLDTTPGRDDQALLLSTPSIIIGQNPRKDLGDLTELKSSIAARGILTPLLIMKSPSGFELLGGHRRLQCAKDLELKDIPCRIIETQEPEVIKLLDNIMREALSPQDECMALKRLLPAFDGNKSALARALSKSPSYVNRAVKAASLIDAGLFAGEQLEERQLSKSALFELAMSPDPKAVLAAAVNGKKSSIREARADAGAGKPGRQPSDPLPGGRVVAQAVQFRDRKGGSAFSLRINFDNERTGPETRLEIIRHLEAALLRLKATLTG